MNNLFLIGGIIFGALLIILTVALFFVSRKSQKVMESLLLVMTQPERTRVRDAARVLNTLLAEEMAKISGNFESIRASLAEQIETAEKLKQNLGEQNDRLIALADDATKKLTLMTGRLDNTVTGLTNVDESAGWRAVEVSTDKFSTTVNELLDRIDKTSVDTTEKIDGINSQIATWMESGKQLSDQLATEFNANTEQMKTIDEQSKTLNTTLTELGKSVADGFEAVKSSAADYETTMTTNDKLMNEYLVKMDNFGKQSKKLLTAQMNTITNTANVVGGQVRLAESSIEKQIRKLTDAVEMLMSSASATESSVRGISGELSGLTNKFNGEIKEFATGAVSELKTVSGVANATLENTKTAAGAFSESVRAMATGVRETLIEMNTAHTQLSGQSANLIKMSAETTAQLQPLSELIERYYSALPDLSRGSSDAAGALGKIVSELTAKIAEMQTTISDSMTNMAESSTKLADLAGQSRQQMIDLMSDYAKAVNTMQTLNKQIMVARATAPMDAISTVPTNTPAARASSRDFLTNAEREFTKMHELSLDLTRTSGAEIPDVVWKKYHAGDAAVFSKWLAKMLDAADKRQIKEMLKSDSVFRSQATQFVRSFDKIMTGAAQTDNADKLSATLLKTDLGRIYSILRGQI